MKISLIVASPLLLTAAIACSSKEATPVESGNPETENESPAEPSFTMDGEPAMMTNEPPEGCTPGAAGCTCVEGLCLGDIECVDNVCFGPEQYLYVPPSEERLADMADEQAASEAVLEQFRECGLVGEGDFFFELDLYSEDELCVAECFNSVATCETAKAYLCDIANVSRYDALDDCVSHCGEFKCSDGRVIPEGYLCDAEPDCDDGEDELQEHCGGSDNRIVLCDGRPRTFRYRCNGVDECEDGYDELNCGDQVFDCGDGTKISRDRVCNLYENCPNGADESEEAGCAPRFCD